MTELVLNIIDRHNKVVKEMDRHGSVKIDVPTMFALMEVNHAFTCEAGEIVKLARALGIDAKYNAQTGYITVYGYLKEDTE